MYRGNFSMSSTPTGISVPSTSNLLTGACIYVYLCVFKFQSITYALYIFLYIHKSETTLISEYLSVIIWTRKTKKIQYDNY